MCFAMLCVAGVEGLAVAPAPKRKIPGKKKVAAAPAVDTSKLQQAEPDQPATAKQQEPPPVLEVDDCGSQDIQRMISEIHGPPGETMPKSDMDAVCLPSCLHPAICSQAVAGDIRCHLIQGQQAIKRSTKFLYCCRACMRQQAA